MSNLQLDWSSAEVSDGKLTVRLDDKPDSEWSARFERTVQLLDHGNWPDINLKKGQITVKQIEEGSEERLRFFLESAVQEANGESEPDQEAEKDETEDEDEPSEDDPDVEMTDRFRAFASEGEAREASEE
jgi:hypothetical protein